MILTITCWVPGTRYHQGTGGTLNPEQRICGFSLQPEKIYFGDFRKFLKIPDVS